MQPWCSCSLRHCRQKIAERDLQNPGFIPNFPGVENNLTFFLPAGKQVELLFQFAHIKSVFDEEVKNPNSWSVTRTDKLPALAWIWWWATVEEVEGYLWHFLMKTYQARTHNISAMPNKSNIWYIHIHVSYDPHSPSSYKWWQRRWEPRVNLSNRKIFSKIRAPRPNTVLFSTDPLSEI